MRTTATAGVCASLLLSGTALALQLKETERTIGKLHPEAVESSLVISLDGDNVTYEKQEFKKHPSTIERR